MNVFIMTDLEGVSNIDSMEMIDPKGKDFPYCQQLMMEDLNAAVEGAKRGGAEKIYTVEGHFDAFAPEKADPRVTIVTMKEWEDVIRSGEIDVYMEVGAHAKAGTMHGFLDHTMSSLQWYKYSINGQQMSEVEINALFVGAFGMPVVMVSGDAAVCRDVQATLGEVAVAPVKKATSRNRAICLPREEALRRICDAAEAGMHIKKGTELILKKQYKEGLIWFEKGAMSKKIKPFTKIRYAFLELKYGDMAKAKKVISLIINDSFVDKKVKYEAKAVWALIAFMEGDIEEATEVCDMLYKNYKNTDVYCTMGYIYNLSKSPEEAVSFNLEAYEYNPDKAVIADNLGQAYYLSGKLDEASEIYEKVMEKNPNFPEAYYNYALVLIKKGNNAEAIKMLEKALEQEFHNLTTISSEKIEETLFELTSNK